MTNQSDWLTTLLIYLLLGLVIGAGIAAMVLVVVTRSP